MEYMDLEFTITGFLVKDYYQIIYYNDYCIDINFKFK